MELCLIIWDLCWLKCCLIFVCVVLKLMRMGKWFLWMVSLRRWSLLWRYVVCLYVDGIKLIKFWSMVFCCVIFVRLIYWIFCIFLFDFLWFCLIYCILKFWLSMIVCFFLMFMVLRFFIYSLYLCMIFRGSFNRRIFCY